jgi:1,4-dihydroxy-2-naphthoyl-CoA hydrolase
MRVGERVGLKSQTRDRWPTCNVHRMDIAADSVRDLFATGGGGTLGERMGIQLSEAAPERVVGTMPIEGNTQPYGLLHGGASCVLAETLGSVGAVMHGQTVDRPFAVGVDINATHHKSARSGVVTGVATPVHRGRTMATYEIVITDETGDRVCTARITCLLRGA